MADCFDHVDSNAVSGLLVCLRIRSDGEKPVNLPLVKALQTQAFSGHQTANSFFFAIDHQHARSFTGAVGEGCLAITSGQTAGNFALFRTAFAQVYQVQPGFPALAACAGGLGTGYSCRIVDSAPGLTEY